MTTSGSSVLSGDERVESWAHMGRLFRKGSLAALSASDQERVEGALDARDAEKALAYLELVKPLYLGMTMTLLEWSIAFPEFLAKVVPAQAQAEATAEAYETWARNVRALTNSPEEKIAGEVLFQVLDPARQRAAPENRNRTKLGQEVNEEPARTHGEATSAVREGRFEVAKERFQHFVAQARSRHDFLCQFLWVFPSVLYKRFDQALTEDVLLRSFETCSFYEPTWKAVTGTDPAGIAAILAEHLRGHFSGPGRKGSVQIIEEPDRFRLVFDGCGSGGALRRLAMENPAPGFDTFKNATPSTWCRANEVSTFCSHCAQNELASLKRLGYPLWVTEYDPDPRKPCGWTIYKDPSKIPEQYFKRLGVEKDASRFRKPGGGQ